MSRRPNGWIWRALAEEREKGRNDVRRLRLRLVVGADYLEAEGSVTFVQEAKAWLVARMAEKGPA